MYNDYSSDNHNHRPAGFGHEGERTPRPRFRRDGEQTPSYSPRPRFQREGDNRSYQPRPRFQREEGTTPRPRFQREEGATPRPRFQREGDNRSFQPRPRFQREGDNRSFQREGDQNQQQRPRFNKPKRNQGVYSAQKRYTYNRQNEDPTKPIRLNKFLANAGICSRREADDFIQAGVITVNGQVADSLGTKVLPTDEVRFHDQPVRREHKVYILLNKPKNTVTTTDDPQERHTVIDIVRNACAERIYPVGRLDRNTTGVLLLTNDGDLAAKLTHPKFNKKKIYAATLDRDLDEVDEAILRAGVVLDDERIIPDALEFPKSDRKHIGLEIHSGQNRVVRRMFEKVGYKVVSLDRVSFAGLTKKNVARGKYRFLNPKEVAMLQMGAFE